MKRVSDYSEKDLSIIVEKNVTTLRFVLLLFGVLLVF